MEEFPLIEIRTAQLAGAASRALQVPFSSHPPQLPCRLKTRAHRSCGHPAHFGIIKRVLEYIHGWALITIEVVLFPCFSGLSKDAFPGHWRSAPGGRQPYKLCSRAMAGPAPESGRVFQLCPEEHSTRKPQSSQQPLGACLPDSFLSFTWQFLIKHPPNSQKHETGFLSELPLLPYPG